MPSIRNILLCLAACSATTYAEHLKVVFSSGAFSTISGPSGSEGGSFTGFAIVNDNGDAVYDNAYPDNHSPCYNTGGGRTFTIAGDCWGAPITFSCEADFGGNPESCSVSDAAGTVLGSASGMTDTTFIGIAIGIDGSCVVEFDSDSAGCPIDDGNGPLKVISG